MDVMSHSLVKPVPCEHSHLEIPSLLELNFARWNFDEALIHVPLRMRCFIVNSDQVA
jgi:hypothetical protein